MTNQPLNIDERIRSKLTDILESHGVGEPDYHVSLDGPEVAAIKQLLRDFYEYVKPSRPTFQYDDTGFPLGDSMNDHVIYGANKAIDEMDTKSKECGL